MTKPVAGGDISDVRDIARLVFSQFPSDMRFRVLVVGFSPYLIFRAWSGGRDCFWVGRFFSAVTRPNFSSMRILALRCCRRRVLVRAC